MNALIGLILLIAVGLIGWGIATLKYKALPFTKSKEEIKAEEVADEKLKQDGYNEMTIKDVVRTISAKGYKAV
jgi:membrane protein required for beta-lactamase induction